MKFFFILFTTLFLTACNAIGHPTTSSNSDPESVLVEAGVPLPCHLLSEPKVIEDLTANYSCDAPGAFLTDVDTNTDPWMSGYLTTNTQTDEITFGPVPKATYPDTKQ